MTYDDFVAQLSAALVIPSDGDRFVTLLPNIISHATTRILREPGFDSLGTRGPADTSQITTRGSRTVPFPPSIVVLERANLVTPANVANPALGIRVPLLRTSRDFIDRTWPDEAQVMTPDPWATYYTINAQFSDLANQIIIAPTPDDTYVFEAYGTHLPPILSPALQTNFLSLYYSDLFFAAAMCVASGEILKNFGAAGMVDDPQVAASWEGTYTKLLAGVSVESMRQKYISSGWSPSPPAPLAAMPRNARAGQAAPPMAAAG